MIFISITAASSEGIDASQTDQTSALIYIARNVGGSMGVSLAQNVLAYRQQFYRSWLGESITSANPNDQDTLRTATQYLTTHGATGVEAQNQVAFGGCIDVFRALSLVSAVPTAMIPSKVRRGGDSPAGH